MTGYRVVGWWHFLVLAVSVLFAVISFNGHGGIKPFSKRYTDDARLQKPLSPASRPASTCHFSHIGSSHRHREEHKKLLQRMRKPSNGKLKANSPRHRLLTALHGFYRYQRTAGGELQRIREAYEKNIKKEKRELIDAATKYEAKIKRTEELIRENDHVVQEIVDCGLEFYGVDFMELSTFVRQEEASGKTAERVSVSQALKHYVRDWAVDGERERISTFPLLLETLEVRFPERSITSNKSDPIRVLVPGAGVGRLAHDIAALGGFEVTANEWSMYMNLAYRYVVSQRHANSKTIYPFIDWWSHQPTTKELHRAVSFPDVSVNFSDVLLVEGDFTTAFNEKHETGSYDAVVTLFFIDTARSVLSYMETIHQVLKPGNIFFLFRQILCRGLWVNLGPLLYGSGPFLQLSLDETVDLAEAVGFEFLQTDPRYGNLTLPGGKGWIRQTEAPYGFNQKALWKNAYWAQYWLARRR
ncbi:hypothetical protein VTO42DRAFT_6628 [Malbranchea cinnamomea]